MVSYGWARLSLWIQEIEPLQEKKVVPNGLGLLIIMALSLFFVIDGLHLASKAEFAWSVGSRICHH